MAAKHGEDDAKRGYEKAVTATCRKMWRRLCAGRLPAYRQAHDKVKSLRDTAEAAA